MENRDGDACRQVNAESSTVMGLEHQAQQIRPCQRHCSAKHRGASHLNRRHRRHQIKVELAVNWAQWEAQTLSPTEYPQTALNWDRRGLATPNLLFEPLLKCLPEK